MTATLTEFVLFGYIAAHYSCDDVRDLADLMGCKLEHNGGLLELAAQLVNACRHAGKLDELVKLVIVQYARLPVWRERVGDDQRIMKLIDSLLTAEHDDSVVLAVAPDMALTIDATRVPQARFLADQVSSTAGIECYMQVAEVMQRCKKYCVILGHDIHDQVPIARACLAEIAFDCAFFRSLPIWVFYPQDGKTRKKLVRRLRKKVTELGQKRVNITLRSYPNDLDLLAAVMSATIPNQDLIPSMELLRHAIDDAIDDATIKRNQAALAKWEKKLEHLRIQEATADPLQLFTIRQGIEECEQKIEKLCAEPSRERESGEWRGRGPTATRAAQ